ncbi:hypothetical protein HY949_03825 [Candidatus Gottesmanbacteria bacterium]|nr:hypothetical protein [Candidatus Gottesmanbacteria bacterium]
MGHTILFESNNLTDTLLGLTNLLPDLEVAVLDCEILANAVMRSTVDDGGTQIAQYITERDSGIGIFSISDQWGRRWKNPKYDASRPHPYDPTYDENGWTEMREPDVLATWVRHDVQKLAQLIGYYTPRDRDEYELAMLEYAQQFWKERRG